MHGATIKIHAENVYERIKCLCSVYILWYRFCIILAYLVTFVMFAPIN